MTSNLGIIANQFKELKRGDRYFYENGAPDISFTEDQLFEIRKISLSKLICDNFDIKQIQPNVFLQPNSDE